MYSMLPVLETKKSSYRVSKILQTYIYAKIPSSVQKKAYSAIRLYIFNSINCRPVDSSGAFFREDGHVVMMNESFRYLHLEVVDFQCDLSAFWAIVRTWRALERMQHAVWHAIQTVVPCYIHTAIQSMIFSTADQAIYHWSRPNRHVQIEFDFSDSA